MQQCDDQIRRLQRSDSHIALADRRLDSRPAVIRQERGEDGSRLLSGQRPEQRQTERILRLPPDAPAQSKGKGGSLKLQTAQPLGQRSKYSITGHGEPLLKRKGAVSFAVGT